MRGKTVHKLKKPDLARGSSLPSRKAKLLMILLSGTAVLLVLVQIYFSGKVAVTGEHIKSLELSKNDLVLENAKLQDKINQISSLAYVEEKARRDLKMVNGVDTAWYLSVSEALVKR